MRSGEEISSRAGRSQTLGVAIIGKSYYVKSDDLKSQDYPLPEAQRRSTNSPEREPPFSRPITATTATLLRSVVAIPHPPSPPTLSFIPSSRESSSRVRWPPSLQRILSQKAPNCAAARSPLPSLQQKSPTSLGASRANWRIFQKMTTPRVWGL